MSGKRNSEIVEKVDESKSLAIKDACVRLLTNCSKGVDVIVSPTQFGCNRATFKASVEGNGDYFVRLLNEGWISRIADGPYIPPSALVQYTHAVGEAGLGPTVLASDGQAMIQEWVEDMVPLLDNFDTIIDDAEHAVAIGALLGRMHQLPVYADKAIRVGPICYTPWEFDKVLPGLCEQDQELENVLIEFDALRTRPPLLGNPGSRLVLVHGDFHWLNVLMTKPKGKQGRPKFHIIDLELCRIGIAVEDIAWFFSEVQMNHQRPEYPPLDFRLGFARGYLQACGLDDGKRLVNELLFAVEYERPWMMMLRMSTWGRRRETLKKKCAPEGVFAISRQLLAAAQAGNKSIKHGILEQGVMEYTHAKAL